MTVGQWMYIYGMEEAVAEMEKEAPNKPRGKTFKIKSQL